MTTTALYGSTGLVGAHVLSTLLAVDSISAVTTVSRREPKSTGAKLNPIINGDTATWAKALSSLSPVPHTVFSAVGTTRAAAGGIANQWKIDHDLNIELARAAKEAGVKTFVFLSSAGVRGAVGSRAPYGKMKVGVEDAIKELDFEHGIILRPGLIMGPREQEHFGGPLMNTIVRSLGSISPGLRDSLGQDAEVIARAMVKAAQLADEGKAPSKYWEIDSSELLRLGRAE